MSTEVIEYNMSGSSIPDIVDRADVPFLFETTPIKFFQEGNQEYVQLPPLPINWFEDKGREGKREGHWRAIRIGEYNAQQRQQYPTNTGVAIRLPDGKRGLLRLKLEIDAFTFRADREEAQSEETGSNENAASKS